jgi:ammonia channel protein AmtB
VLVILYYNQVYKKSFFVHKFGGFKGLKYFVFLGVRDGFLHELSKNESDPKNHLKP